MIRNKFTPVSAKVKREQIDLFADIEYTLKFEGFMYENGKFAKGYSIVRDTSFLEPPEKTKSLFVSDDGEYAYASYSYSDTEDAISYCAKGANFISRPTCRGDRPFFADVTAPNGTFTPTAFAGPYRLVATNGVMSYQTNKTYVKGGVVHDNKLFAIDGTNPYRIRWDDCINDVWAANEFHAGYVDLKKGDGVPLRLLSLDQHRLVIVKSGGFNVINTYGLPMNYKLENTVQVSAGGEVIEPSCAVSNGKVYFYTLNGLHSFDGNEVKKVKDFCEGMYMFPTCATALGNKYYLGCRGYMDSFPAIFIYDTQTGACGIVNGGGTALGTSKTMVYSRQNRYVVQVRKASVLGKWESKDFEFSFGKACLTEIILDCADDTKTEIKSEYGTIVLRGGGKRRITLPGKKFSIVASSKSALNGLKLTAEATSL